MVKIINSLSNNLKLSISIIYLNNWSDKIINILIKFKKIKITKTINLNGKQYCMKKYNHIDLYKEADLFNKWYTPYYNKKLAKPYKKKKN